MINITADNFISEVEEFSGLCVIDLYADWCMPCKMLSPILYELEAELPDVKFAKINVDNERELVAAFHVDSIPMIALVKNNTFLDFLIGLTDRATLLEFIRSNM